VTLFQREVCFANRTITVKTDDARGRDIIDHLFTDIDTQTTVTPHCRFSIKRIENEWLLEINTEEDVKTLYRGASAGDLASVLVGEVIYHLTDRCDSGLVFHAAAVTRDGATAALPAASGSGKTTLCAWLVSQGWTYLSDELVHVPLGSDEIQAFTRPFNFKRPAYPVVTKEFGLSPDADYALTGSFASLIAHRQLADRAIPDTNLTLTHLVFPRYTPSHTGQLSKLTPARAGLALMECLVNARNLPEHGFNEVGRLVRQIQPWAFEYSDFETARTKLLPVLENATAQ